jgi:hypothetical protein
VEDKDGKKYYRFSYETKFGRTYELVKGFSIEAAHEEGKRDAIRKYPSAHAFLTENMDYEESA